MLTMLIVLYIIFLISLLLENFNIFSSIVKVAVQVILIYAVNEFVFILSWFGVKMITG